MSLAHKLPPAEAKGACSMQQWEYLVVPLEDVGGLKKRGDVVAWPVVLLKRPVE